MITLGKTSIPSYTPYINGVDFKSSLISHKSKPIAISLQKTKSVRKQDILPRFEIQLSDFNCEFSFEIIKIEGELPSEEIILQLGFENNVIKVILSGDWKEKEGLYVNNFDFGVLKQGETPISVFLLKTLWAMLGLSKKVKIQIPVLDQDATMSFQMALNEISDLLQIRQLAYRMMVIEKSFNLSLPFPQFIDGKDVENIAYCYHSIIDRKFEWFNTPNDVPWFATPEYLSLLPEKNIPFPVQYGPEHLEVQILGHSINLGLQTIRIEKYVIENFEEVKKQLSKLDGNEVLTRAFSKNGVMQVESVTTPHLPKNAFSNRIQKLIDLDEKFNSIFLERYFKLAASTLEGLSEEQKESITERPKLSIKFE